MQTMAYPQQDTHGNVQMHDELAALFSRNMTFNPELQPAEATQQSQVQDQSTAPQKITYSASQHYYHSAHIAKPQVEQAEIEPPKQIQRPSSVPPQSDVIAPEVILRNYGVDPSNLTSAQIQLFKTAEDQQKLRLLELWSICPPPSGAQNIPALAWSSTSLEQEEHLARVRYERTQQEQGMVMDNAMSQNANGHWTQPESEPYMASGYEELMRREQEQNSANDKAMNAHSHFGSTVGEPSYTKATDPVYLGPDYAREQQQMEMATQYGAFEYFRGTPAVDVMDVM